MARTGRPPGGTCNREAILAAAARHFSELGYDRTSMRSIASEAGVDQALIAHYFGSKHELFIAAVEFPLDPAKILPEVLAGDRISIGERLARVQLNLLENPDARRRLTGLIRAASSEPDAARMLREFLMREVIGPVAEALAVDEAELRVSLVGSQIVGLMTARVHRRVGAARLPAGRARRGHYRPDPAALSHAPTASEGLTPPIAIATPLDRSTTYGRCSPSPPRQEGKLTSAFRGVRVTVPGSILVLAVAPRARCRGADHWTPRTDSTRAVFLSQSIVRTISSFHSRRPRSILPRSSSIWSD